jgi:hypothetical protein
LITEDEDGWQDDEERGQQIISSYKAAADKRVTEARQRIIKAQAEAEKP